MRPRPSACLASLPARVAGAVSLLALQVALARPAVSQTVLDRDTDRIDITGRQNLTLGSGARPSGLGGAFLARPHHATAASWNPADLSYLRSARK